VDIETSSLRFEDGELLSISFSYNDTSAIVIPIHQILTDDEEVSARTREVLKALFKLKESKLVFHNGLFDVKFLIWELFMDNPNDYQGRSEGADCFNIDDTMVMAFACLNSTARPSLSLKDLAYEHVGDYAVEVKNLIEALDNDLITKDELLEYNGKDTAATFYLYEKFTKQLEVEEQRHTYDVILQPAINYLVQMMLNGLPLSIEKVHQVKQKITEAYEDALLELRGNNYVSLTVRQLRMNAADKYNATHKVKQKTYGDFMDLKFNPNSSAQLALLLFDIMEYEPIEHTPKGAPKTNRDTIKELMETEQLAERRSVLEALITISQTSIILTTFLDTFEQLWYNTGSSDIGRLYGNQRLGGTQSGRLSSSNP
jgi:DNA polymerase-1